MEWTINVPGWNLIIPIIGIVVFAAIHLVGDRQRDRARSYEIVLMYAIGILGFSGITGFLVHTLFADEVAESIGWAVGSPFQLEVAGANLGIGLIGFLGFWRRDFWLPFVIAKTAFSWTAGAVHVADAASTGNLAPNNVGPIVWWDFLAPIFLLTLYVLMRRSRGPELVDAMPTRPLTMPRTLGGPTS